MIEYRTICILCQFNFIKKKVHVHEDVDKQSQM